ncbi:MAG: serine hydrolase [Candidatus Aminicenantes bacterium]|nr:serine hydrolase [Candidatus Aminicenantes bacterium]
MTLHKTTTSILFYFCLFFLIFAFFTSCTKQSEEEILASTLEREIPRLMEAANIPGLSIAVVHDGKIAWNKAFGVKSRQTNEPVNDNTIFEAASLTKTVTAYAAMRLVERGELELDKPLHEYFPDKEYKKLSGDERYKKITARLVLTHTTGLPNWGVRLMRDPGLQYAYSGEGFLYLGRTIEEISGMTLQEFAQKEIFDPLGMSHTSYVWNETYAANGACGHDSHGSVHDLRKGTDPNGGASLLTTASDYATFICAVLNAKGLTQKTIDQMISRHVQVTKNRNTAELFDNVYWGLGWGIQPGDTGYAFWHWGDNGDLRAYTVTYKNSREGFVYFANSNNGLAIAEAVSALIVPDHQYALDWLEYEKYDDPKRQTRLAVETAFIDEGTEAGMKKLREAKEIFPELAEEEYLTGLAEYLGESGKQKDAVAVFEYCLKTFPKSADAYLGLGLTHMDLGQNQKAIESFESALNIRKGHRLTTRALQWAKEALKVEKNPVALSAAEMEKFVSDYGPRHIFLRDGSLYYRREDRPEYRLIPLTKDTFALDGNAQFRLKFVADETGLINKIVGLYIQGNTDESLRGE